MFNCPYCGFDLRENASSACPGCGNSVEWNAAESEDAFGDKTVYIDSSYMDQSQESTARQIIDSEALIRRAENVAQNSPLNRPQSEPPHKASGSHVHTPQDETPTSSVAGNSDDPAVCDSSKKASSQREDTGQTISPQSFPKDLLHTLEHHWGSDSKESDNSGATIKGSTEKTVEAPSLNIGIREIHRIVDSESQLADYELFNQIGLGGMGVIYEARQTSIDRTVALKMLHAEKETITGDRTKFLSEAVVTGELDHPSIVPIYDVGSNRSGKLFYSMKKVEGTPWKEVVAERSLTENLDVLKRVGDALAFAHSRGVIHRDLKPDNVMLGQYGEVLLMDWGIALVLPSFQKSNTIGPSSGLAGTPAYMAPEMVLGPLDAIGSQSDVYLLGAVLFEILTGLPPHPGDNVRQCLEEASRNRIRQVNEDGELMDIAMKAMSTIPEDRYENVEDFLQAIRDYESHSESIRLTDRALDQFEDAEQSQEYEMYARASYGFQEALDLWPDNFKAEKSLSRVQLAYAESAFRKDDLDLARSQLDDSLPEHNTLLRKVAKAQKDRSSRQRRLSFFKVMAAGLVCTIILVITGALLIIEQKRVEAEAAKEESISQELLAIEARNEEKRQREIAVAASAKAKQESIDAENARKLALDGQTAAEKARIDAEKARTEETYQAYIAQIGLASKKIDESAFANGLSILSRYGNSPLRNWEWGHLFYLCKQSKLEYMADGPVEAVAYSSDGSHVAMGSWDGKLRVYSLSDEKVVNEFFHGQYVYSVAFSPDGRLVASGSSDPVVRIWDTKTRQQISALEGHLDAVVSATFSSDGKTLLTSSFDETTRLWDISTGSELQVLRGHSWWVWDAAMSPDQRLIVTVGQDGKAVVWESDSTEKEKKYQVKAKFLGHSGPIYCVDFSPNGRLVVTGGSDSKENLRVWNPDLVESIDLHQALQGKQNFRQQSQPLLGHEGSVRSVAFSADGNQLVSGGNDNTVRIWNVQESETTHILRGHGSWVRSVAFSPDGTHVLSGGHDNLAKIWNPSRYEEKRIIRGNTLLGHDDSVLMVRFSPDGKQLVTASRDHTARIWNTATGEPTSILQEGHEFLTMRAMVFPAGRRLATASADGTVRVWDMARMAEIYQLTETGPHANIAVSPNSSWIATGSDKGGAKLYQADTGRFVTKVATERDGREITAIAFSSDNRRLFVGDSEGHGDIYLYEQRKWTLQHKLQGHSRQITAALFLPSGEILLTASGDSTIEQWNVSTGKNLTNRLMRHPGWVNSMSLSPDGKTLLTNCGWDKTSATRLWDIETATVVDQLGQDGDGTSWVNYSPDGSHILTANMSRATVRLWDTSGNREIFKDGQPFLNLSESSQSVLWSAVFSRDGEHVVTVGGNSARLWNVNSGEEIASFSPHQITSAVAFSNDGKRIVTGGWDSSLKIWDAETGRVIHKLTGGHSAPINSTCFSPVDENHILSASNDSTAKIWDAESGEDVLAFRGHSDRVHSATFSQDGRLVVTASHDLTARIWDATTGRPLAHGILKGHSAGVLNAAFSENGLYIVTGSEDKTARIWETSTGKLLATLRGHVAPVDAVAFAPGQTTHRVVTGSRDRNVIVWDMQGKEILTLKGHDREVNSLAFSPDGLTLASAGQDGQAILWFSAPWRNLAPKDGH